MRIDWFYLCSGLAVSAWLAVEWYRLGTKRVPYYHWLEWLDELE